MSEIRINVAKDFSPTPGSRYDREGEFSGEEFRTCVLFPRLQEALDEGSDLHVDLDGTAGYGTSFLEEAFGGLVRNDGVSAEVLHAVLKLASREEDYLIADIWGYIDAAAKGQPR